MGITEHNGKIYAAYRRSTQSIPKQVLAVCSSGCTSATSWMQLKFDHNTWSSLEDWGEPAPVISGNGQNMIWLMYRGRGSQFFGLSQCTAQCDTKGGWEDAGYNVYRTYQVRETNLVQDAYPGPIRLTPASQN